MSSSAQSSAARQHHHNPTNIVISSRSQRQREPRRNLLLEMRLKRLSFRSPLRFHQQGEESCAHLLRTRMADVLICPVERSSTAPTPPYKYCHSEPFAAPARTA